MTHRLELAIGYKFSDPSLLLTALTHRSYGVPHNERLEFLGDSILNGVIARELFERFPDLPEGDLSRLRANLVQQETLHQLAVGVSLGNYLRLGDGELKSGGAQRPSILADALEAIFGAIWLDKGFDAARVAIVGLFEKRLVAITPGKAIKDAKSRLQEHLQGRRLPLPKYTLVETSGEAHMQQFKVACEVDSLDIQCEGQGSSRRIAEQMAAQRVLERLR